jgi:coenzyme PQQ biosynthesis protein PqqD
MVVLPERAVKPSASGREILALCDGSRSAVAIARELRKRHPDVPELTGDVHEFLAEMQRLGVLAPSESA